MFTFTRHFENYKMYRNIVSNFLTIFILANNCLDLIEL